MKLYIGLITHLSLQEICINKTWKKGVANDLNGHLHKLKMTYLLWLNMRKDRMGHFSVIILGYIEQNPYLNFSKILIKVMRT